jgi:nucleotidyltransferase/DNA polymerase involved in DNA repair
MTTPLALVDVNNAYVSMERIFNSQLQRQGVVVVGSNDGNIV